MFYLSSYLESHREEYYARLQDISQNGDWNAWIAFFLRAVAEQSKTNNAKVKKEGSILKEIRPASGRRAGILCFPALLNIAEGKQIL